MNAYTPSFTQSEAGPEPDLSRGSFRTRLLLIASVGPFFRLSHLGGEVFPAPWHLLIEPLSTHGADPVSPSPALLLRPLPDLH